MTDNTGIPLEFMITTAVRPTRAQQILFGNRLKSYVAINLCGKQLLQDVKTKPRVVFVREEWMLNLISQTDIPVLLLQHTEQLGSASVKPTAIPPKSRPEFGDLIDLASLDADMVDAFDRIERSREVLAMKSDGYKI